MSELREKTHCFNIDIAKAFGLKEAIIFKNICFWIDKNEADEQNIIDGKCWTYCSISAMEKLFPYLTSKQIRSSIDSLISQGLICKGNFNKNPHDRTTWYALTDKGEAVAHNWQTDLPSGANGNDQMGKSYIYNKKPNKEYEDVKTDNTILSFSEGKPTMDDGIKEIIDFLNLKTGKHYSTRSKASVKMIRERLREGYTVDEFKAVIQNKVNAWLHDTEWEKYLRPETLFCAKHFDSYLNDIEDEKHRRDREEREINERQRNEYGNHWTDHFFE